MKEHYKTDWHRYNLKRKAANLPVVSMELFEQLSARQTVAQAQRDAKEKAKEEKYARRGVQSRAAQQGLSFREAQARLASEAQEGEGDEEDSGGEWEEMSGDEAEQVLQEQAQLDARAEAAAKEMEAFQWNACKSLFDSYQADTVPDAVRYMGNKFGFFVPDSEFVSDLNGMLRYLAMKIELGKQCLHCNKELKDAEATRKHMVDKSHCKLRYGQLGDEDAEEELEDFYTYPASMDVGDGQLVAVGEEAPAALTTQGLEMVVNRTEDGSGGQIIGSRSMARYYKQRPKPTDNREDVEANMVVVKERKLAGGLVSMERITARQQATAHRIEFKATIKNRAQAQNAFMQGNKNRNLPNNVPY